MRLINRGAKLTNDVLEQNCRDSVAIIWIVLMLMELDAARF